MCKPTFYLCYWFLKDLLTCLAVLPPVFTSELSSSRLKLPGSIFQVLCNKWQRNSALQAPPLAADTPCTMNSSCFGARRRLVQRMRSISLRTTTQWCHVTGCNNIDMPPYGPLRANMTSSINRKHNVSQLRQSRPERYVTCTKISDRTCTCRPTCTSIHIWGLHGDESTPTEEYRLLSI